MKNRHRVVWTKGMFLTPQHFQTQHQFLEENIQFRFLASNYANWGVTELDIDSEALGNGHVRLTKCSGIMPDGEAFDIPNVDDMPPSRSVVEHFPPTKSSLDVFLAIPENRLRARNVGLRVFAVATPDGWRVMPGGLTRVAAEGDARGIAMQRGGRSKDTWVLSDAPINAAFSLLSRTVKPEDLVTARANLPSRAAENLFWFGRYGERCEATVRLLRVAIAGVLDDNADEADGNVKRRTLPAPSIAAASCTSLRTFPSAAR